MSDIPDEARQAIRRQILDAYGFASVDELNAAIEEEFPGWLAAHAEYEAHQAAYRAALPNMMERARQHATAELAAQGMALPDGIELVWSTA